MIYFCADDYGLCESASANIQRCIDCGAIDKVSIFPNIGQLDLNRITGQRKIRVALHVNLVEGMCMASADTVNLLADRHGRFQHTFFGLLCQSLLHPKVFEEQVYQEIRAQVLFWKSHFPDGAPLCIDSHQHTHMIPGVFKALLRVIQDENIQLKHMRIPAEPILPYVKVPSLYFTYSPINLVKQWLLKFLWLVNRKQVKDLKIPTAYFMGILFSGNMDERRVSKVLPEYIKLAEKHGSDIEVLFHPGYLEQSDIDFEKQNIVFQKFYYSDTRKTEFDVVMKIGKEGCSNGLHRA